MNIGIDIDGVLTDFEMCQLKYARKYFKNISNFNREFFDIKDITGCTHREKMKFWQRYILSYCIFEKPREDAGKVLKELQNEGHKIYIITARVFVTEKNIKGILFKFILKNWLRRSGIIYDHIGLCSDMNSATEKVNFCKKLGVDVMLEDNVDNIMEISKLAKVICFDASYNRVCEGDNIFRVSNFQEAYEVIKKLDSK